MAIPVPIKTRVDAMDRADTRETPQTPCPLVHPEPRRVLKPTRKPAIMIVGAPADNSNAMDWPVSDHIKGALTRPITNRIRHNRSSTGDTIMPDAMPLIPAIRPFNAINRTAAAPISAPPKLADTGVNSVKIVSTLLKVCAVFSIRLWTHQFRRFRRLYIFQKFDR